MDEEYRSLTATLKAFLTFRKFQYEQIIKPKSIKFNLLSQEDKDLLDTYPRVLKDYEHCIDVNQQFTEKLAFTAAQDWGVPQNPDSWADPSFKDYDKVRSTLLQLSREWSTDGKEEREKSFGQVIGAVCELFPNKDRENVKVLVPGCGLGRLVYEFVKRGFWTQGNEISYHMLLALSYMLNRVPEISSQTVFPFIHGLSNLAKRLDSTRPVLIPDESAMSIFSSTEAEIERVGELMSMAAGLFVDLYGPPGLAESETYTQDENALEFRSQNASTFNVVATCFFIDTATNIIDYVKTIHHCLQDNGLWINVGPLQWHFEGDSSTELVTKVMKKGEKPEQVQTVLGGLELSREELFGLIEKMGFVFEQSDFSTKTTYSTNVKAFSNYVYTADFWVARKKPVEA